MTQLPPQAPYPSQPPYGAPGMVLKPHRGTTVLVLGILGLACCWPLGIAAWVMGNNDLREIDAGRMDPTGRGTTNGGKICGIVGVCLGIIQLIFGILGLIYWVAMAATMANQSR